MVKGYKNIAGVFYIICPHKKQHDINTLNEQTGGRPMWLG